MQGGDFAFIAFMRSSFILVSFAKKNVAMTQIFSIMTHFYKHYVRSDDIIVRKSYSFVSRNRNFTLCNNIFLCDFLFSLSLRPNINL